MDEKQQKFMEDSNTGFVFMMQLLMEEPCIMPTVFKIETVLRKHLGEDAECFSHSHDVASIAVNKLETTYGGQSVSPVLSIFGCTEFESFKIDDAIRAQMWNCPEHEEILSSCKYQVIASDMLTDGLNYKDRADMVMDYMEALVELFPTCKAVYFRNCGKLFTSEMIRRHRIPREDRFIYFAVNVRYFNNQDSNAMLVDSVGMQMLHMPDIQYLFHGADPSEIAEHAYDLLSYIYNYGNPIKNGDIIDGISSGKITTDLHWKCKYDMSLLMPVREVIDIHMGKLASGNRED